MTARSFKVDNSLRRSVSFNAGLPVAEAVQAAERSLAELPPPTLADADALIAALQGGLGGAGRLPAELARRMYARANDLIGVSRACGMDELGQAAFRLCDALDQLDGAEAAEPDQIQAMLGNLHELRDRGAPVALAKAEEWARVHALHESGLLKDSDNPLLARISRLARAVAGTEVAVVTLLAETTQYLRGAIGVALQETPRGLAFCNYTIQSDDVLWVEDLALDPRFANHPLVVNPPNARFYAGAPIVLRSGHRLGSVCVLGRAPRPMDEQVAALLQDLAGVAAADIDRRISEVRAAKAEANSRAATDTLVAFVRQAPAEMLMTDTRLRVLHMSERWCAAHGCTPAEILGRSVLEFPEAGAQEQWRGICERALSGVAQSGETRSWPMRPGVLMRWEVAPWRSDGAVAGLLSVSTQLDAS